MANENTGFTLNGYSYADGKATFNGIELPGVTSFDFKKTKGKRNNYGLGANPVSRTRLQAEYSGSMDMDHDTQRILSPISPTGLLTEVPPGVLILTLSRDDGGVEVMTLTTFEFEDDGLSGSQGDENLTQSIVVMFGSMIKETF